MELSIFLLLSFCLFLGTESAREGSLNSKIEAKNTNTIERESSMPISSILVKKSMEENKNNNKSTEENKNFSKPSEHRQISRERVDKGIFSKAIKNMECFAHFLDCFFKKIKVFRKEVGSE